MFHLKRAPDAVSQVVCDGPRQQVDKGDDINDCWEQK